MRHVKKTISIASTTACYYEIHIKTCSIIPIKTARRALGRFVNVSIRKSFNRELHEFTRIVFWVRIVSFV